jgi:hypothetical protein
MMRANTSRPCRGRSRGGDGQIIIDGVIAEPDQWPQHPAFSLDQFADIGVTVIGFGFEHAAELGFRVGKQNRRIQLALIAEQDRLVVGNDFGRHADQQQPGKYP